ncbi:hypothetical protein B0919_06870 [Hymenobacter sp. CRA2]|nr:hypothetical protein B0919_06870 [Hymenobacter sp. CRA2]
MRLVLLLLLGWAEVRGQAKSQFVTSDIDHFWQAYDKITATQDSAQQYAYLNSLFIQRGSPGLKALMEVRDYTAQSYLEAIRRYPRFWQAMRQNTGRANQLARQAGREIRKLQRLYPEARPATVYFTVGALRSGGTSQGRMVLVGSETALATPATPTTEFGPELAHLPAHFKTKTDADVLFTVVHEYVHTQQKTTVGTTLLAQSVLEGVAEFAAVTATGQPSTLPAMHYGRAHADAIRQRFAGHMFNPFAGFWLYSNAPNEFDNSRDLGYYVGYAICELYYQRAADKQAALKAMIELDYNDEAALRAFVDQAGYFAQPTAQLYDAFQASRPRVLRFARAAGPAAGAGTATLTLTFSSPMDPAYRNFELGPLGRDHLMRIKKLLGFSDDYTSATFEIDAPQPNRRYQLVVGEGFRSRDGRPLQPFLIDFSTDAK